MKTLGILKTVTLSSFLVASIFVFDACNTDPCKDVTCENGGTPTETSDGEDCFCDCKAGYEGDKCQTVSRKRFLATYDVDDGCTSSNYTSEIKEASAIDEVLITEFGKYLCNGQAPTVKASVDSTTLTIAKQNFCNDQFWIKGSGSISSDEKKVTITYTTQSGSNAEEECTAVLTKQ